MLVIYEFICNKIIIFGSEISGGSILFNMELPMFDIDGLGSHPLGNMYVDSLH